MKYQCSNGHIFLFPMISRVGLSEHTFTEVKLCPEGNCASRHIEEYVEPEPEIVSMKSVDINQVDEYLKQGYKVKESSTTKACIVKYTEIAPKDAEPEEVVVNGVILDDCPTSTTEAA
jgi:hypothetical protein